MVTRRELLLTGGAAAATAAVLASAKPAVAAEARGEYTPVIVPNGATLEWKRVGNAKVFHLVAEEVEHQMAPGLKLECWGYNGRTPGPVIEVVEGDRVRIYVTNRLPEPTSVHWHGVLLPNGMDGVAGLTQPHIKPGETFKYEFTFKHPGTFMYHPHFDEMTQMALGMMGMIVVHPRRPTGPKIDRDFALMLSEWLVEPGSRRPNPTAMADFNMLTFNSVAFPATEPLVVKTGDRVRIRLGNLSAMDHHPIHIHGHAMRVTATDGGPIPRDGQWPETAVLVPVGTTRDVEFVADAPGDWPFHCHMTHHIMNQMGHEGPNMTGVRADLIDKAVKPLIPSYMTMGADGMGAHAEHAKHMRMPKNSIPMLGADGPFGLIDMGGMFTIMKVRDRLKGYEDPGWYEHPRGEVASLADANELERDGIEIKPSTKPVKPAGGGSHDHHGGDPS